jgi:hypothetical protein
MLSQPSWLATVETLTFCVLITVTVYNRLVNWRKYNERTTALEIAFRQYQTDMKTYLATCESCRLEVRVHHEDSDKHVTKTLQNQIDRLAEAVDEIKTFLMTSRVK